MDRRLTSGISAASCFVAFGKLAQLYIWPLLQVLSREDALNGLVVPHMFRFVGLGFLTPGIVSPDLSPAFAKPAAYGELAAAGLAVVATFALAAGTSWALTTVWPINVEGGIDLLFAYYQGAKA